MRAHRLLSAAVATVSAVVSAAALVALPASVRADTPPVHYYVALGDSLSVGHQPSGDTNQGYADDVYSTLHAHDAGLVLVKLGCSGETTTSMISQSVCQDGRYASGSQLTDAVAFLRAHGSAVKYLTLDIGANDVDGCLPNGSVDAACLAQGALTITQNLHTILTALNAADGGVPQSVGMTYYDPFLAMWLSGLQGQVLATASVALALSINTVETLEYGADGFKIADVATTFKTTNFGSQTLLGTPINVQTICAWTWMCSVGNIHANATGYQQIANTFLGKLTY